MQVGRKDNQKPSREKR